MLNIIYKTTVSIFFFLGLLACMLAYFDVLTK